MLMPEGEGGNNQHYVRGAGRGRVTKGEAKVVVVSQRKYICGTATWKLPFDSKEDVTMTMTVSCWQCD